MKVPVNGWRNLLHILVILNSLIFACLQLRGSEVTLQDAIKYAYSEMQNNKYEAAQQWLAYVLTREPANFDAQFLQAQIELRNQAYTQALHRVDWLLTSKPNLLEYRVLRLKTLELMGDSESASKESKNILVIDANNSDALSFLASVDKSQVKSVKTSKDKKNDDINHATSSKAKKPESFRAAAKLIIEDPEILSSIVWSSSEAIKRAKGPEKVEDKVLRLFVQWKFGEIASKDLAKELRRGRINTSKCANDNVALRALNVFLQEGLLVNDITLRKKRLASWVDHLKEHSRCALMLGNYEEAWQRHLEAISESDTWHYCAARIALDRWAMEGVREVVWLHVAREHLASCIDNSQWKYDAAVLLREIDLRLNR